jgi:hypothetical protein
MSLEEDAEKGRAILAEREAEQRASEESEHDERHTRRLARVYGMDPDGRGYSIYLGGMGVVVALMGVGISRSMDKPILDTPTLGFAAMFAVWGLAAYAWDAYTRKVKLADAKWMRSRPYRFDVDAYETAAAAYDHGSGWMRVSVHFAKGAVDTYPELRSRLANAAVGLGAHRTRWADADRLWIKSPTLNTDVDTENASYTTARPLHAWFRKFAEHGLSKLATSVAIEKVSVRFGFFEDGSFSVDDEDEADANDADESESDEDGSAEDET